MYMVVMQSDEYGEEQFPQDTLADAMDCIKRLLLGVEVLNDGIERVIGIKLNQSETDDWNPGHSDTTLSFTLHHPPPSSSSSQETGVME